jgi:hypothetical protein
MTLTITITANGGAMRFWSNLATGERAVLRCNGRTLLLPAHPYARWKLTTRDPAEPAWDPRWRADTAIAATGQSRGPIATAAAALEALII